MRAQGAQENAKEDTVLLGIAADADIWTDLSQYLTDLTGEEELYEDPTTRANLTGVGGRELYVRAEFVDDLGSLWDTEVLVHADPAAIASNTYRIRFDNSLNVVFMQGATTLYTVASGLTGSMDLGIHWSTRDNPDTTGAGNALISEFVLYNFDGGVYIAIEQVAHAVPATDVDWAVTVGGFWNGAAVTLVSTLAPHSYRIGRAWHPSTEFAEDWVSQRAAPDADAHALECLVPVTVASTLGDDGQWTGGPNIAWVAAHNERQRRSMWGPLVNDVYSDAEAFGPTNDPVPWVKLAPGSSLYEMRIDWLRWCVVPVGATHAYVRVQVRSHVTAGAAVPIRLRMYAFNRPEELSPGKYPDASKFAYTFETSSLLTVDNTSTGRGQWLEIGPIKLPIFDANVTGFIGTTHLCLATAIDPASTSGNDANARITVRAQHARPMYLEQPNLEKG
jgi:hypothetical protein